MNNPKQVLLIIFSLILCFSSNAKPNDQGYPIPYPEDAKVFAEFTDKLPAVLNYFTDHTEQEVIDFYQEKYGKVNSREIKRGRLTLYFSHNEKQLRVIISPQSKKLQIDVFLK
jgi:hypothetical protein